MEREKNNEIPIFMLGLHCHQPVGNFDHVIEDNFNRSYLPFLEKILPYGHVKIALHVSGYLLQWIATNSQRYVELVKELIKEGRLEIIGGGFYEPLLSTIPEPDRREQVEWYSDYLEKLFGVRPKGLWLAERVWDEGIVKSLSKIGIKYVFLDDYHFLSSGFSRDELRGYYVTEEEGYSLGIFPIDQNLRYLIPFKEPGESLSYLNKFRGKLSVLFDDGEKFGSWPGTYHWVYEEGWLLRFVKEFGPDRIRWVLPHEWFSKNPPLGIAYLPNVSYFEMGEWSLPAEAAYQFRMLYERFKRANQWGEIERFFRGGIWKNFFVKYSESNYMHKRMLQVSRKTRRLKGKNYEKARIELMKAQSNDPFWHGIFGGLYLPHLRKALFEHLIKAESVADGSVKKIRERDIDLDGFKEIIVTNQREVFVFSPRWGGTLVEWSLRKYGVNLLNVIKRRPEHYHFLPDHGTTGRKEEEEVETIHEISKKIPPELREILFYDRRDRRSFWDRILPFSKDLTSVIKGEELVSLADLPYCYDLKGDSLLLKVEQFPFDLQKEFFWQVDKEELRVSYRVKSKSPEDISLIFSPQINLSFSSVKTLEILTKKEKVDADEPGIRDGESIRFIDWGWGYTVFLSAKGARGFHIYPIYTLSQSEKGFDKTFQGLSVEIIYPLRLSPQGEAEFEMKIRVGPAKKKSF